MPMRSALHRSSACCALPVALALAILVAEPAPDIPERGTPDRAGGREDGAGQIRWRDSVALGLPESGSLVRGVRFPARGRSFFTWDPIRRQRPNRAWRRWGTDELLRIVLGVLRDFQRARPAATRVGVGDLSRPRGGDFGARFGGIGHETHQNGLDVDVYYPRVDGRERPPERVDQVNLDLSQDLVERFLAAGAERIYIGPNTSLSGPPEIVQPLVNHDNHMHVRISGRG